MFWYLPLESYKERYTSLMSVKDGWIEDKMKKAGLIFKRIEGTPINSSGEINNGVVLDFAGRAYYSLTQNAEVVRLINNGTIKDGDTLYYDDFWTPGMEGVRYAAELAGINLNIYAMIHAQSVDKYDFIAKLKYWVRHYEVGQSKFMKGIFVTSEYLLDLCVEAGIENVYYGGLPYNKEFITNKFPLSQTKISNRVVYCSRFDSEKNPWFFIEVARKLKPLGFDFVMTTSAKEVRSNNPALVSLIKKAADEGIITLKVGLTKEEYYQELQKAEYQFNSAAQDWLSWTMLEALTYKCIPVYPKYRAFPEYLPGEYMYEPWDVDSAAKVILNSRYSSNLETIVEKFDHSFNRYIEIMKSTGGI